MLKTIAIQIDEKLAMHFKARCASEGMKMTDVIRTMIQEYLDGKRED